MRKLGLVLAAGLVWAGVQLLVAPPAAADLKVSVNGQIRFNVIYADQIWGSGQTIAPTDLPFDSGPKANKETDHSQTVLDARRTRFWVDATDTAGNIKLMSRIQVDFNTGDGNAKVSNSRHLRLRLAYGQATTPEGFTLRAGQVRTILSEFGDNLIGGVGAPDVINENGHFTQLQARQPGIQLAWTAKAAGGDLTVGAAVEKQGVDVKSRTGLSAAVDEGQGAGQDVPFFGGGIRYRSPLFSVFARGAVSKARVILSGTGKDEDETVWLGAVGLEVKPTAMLTVMGQYWFTDGLNRINGTFKDVALVGGDLEGVEAQAFLVGVQLKATKALTFNVVYEWMEADDDPKIFDLSRTSGDKETIQTFNINVIYKFWTRWDTGIEYQYGKVDSFGASDGTINIVNYRLRFYF